MKPSIARRLLLDSDSAISNTKTAVMLMLSVYVIPIGIALDRIVPKQYARLTMDIGIGVLAVSMLALPYILRKSSSSRNSHVFDISQGG